MPELPKTQDCCEMLVRKWMLDLAERGYLDCARGRMLRNIEVYVGAEIHRLLRKAMKH